MKTIGQILLWAGFLSGALATVYCPPRKAVEFVKQLSSQEQLRLANLKDQANDQVPKDETAEAVEPPQYELPDLSDVAIPVDDWSQIPWVWYGLSAGVCLAGVVLIQVSKTGSQDLANQNLASLDQIQHSLAESLWATQRLHKQIDILRPSEVVAQIDATIIPHLSDFAENRDRLAAEFGLAVFADVMTNFAAGERSINRAWSAAADGYLDEVSICLNRGAEMLQQAQLTLGPADAKSGE